MTQAFIGFLHSTKFTDAQEAAFRKGLSDNNWPANRIKIFKQRVDTEGKYGPGHDDLVDEAKHHFNQNRVNLIVTAGGLTVALAASRAMNALHAIKPIVFLVGRVPKNAGEEGYEEFKNDPNLVGGAEFATTVSNNARRDALVQKFGVPAATVALLVNSNSSMWQAELAEWTQAGNNLSLIYPDLLGTPEKDNDYERFPVFFSKVAQLPAPKKPSAIVVSSDPFFYRFRTRLIKGAKAQFDVKLCFAFDEYKLSDEWDQNRHIVVGGKLLDGYYSLGVKAAAALTNLFPSSVGIKTLGSP